MKTRRERITSLVELLLAAFIVIAHNVYHWLPNEVPILVILAIASLRLREGIWITALYERPKSWPRTLLAAVICVGLLQLKDMVVEPIGHFFWPAPQHVSSIISQSHGLSHTMQSLLFVWVFAAFGEEIGYRGFMLRRAVDVFGPSRSGNAAALIIASVAFGFGHFYKGPAGILDSTGSGLILGAAYLYSSRLWTSTLTHGLNDTIAVVFWSLGWFA